MKSLIDEIADQLSAASEFILQKCSELLEFWGVGLLGIPLLIGLSIFGVVSFDRSQCHIRMAIGAKSSGFEKIGDQYKAYLKKFGIELELINTAGAAENLEYLRAGRVDVALVQSSVEIPKKEDNIISLGSVGYEPTWIFYRGKKIYEESSDFSKIISGKICIGQIGSATHAMAMEILKGHEADGRYEPLSIATNECIPLLLSGEVTSIFLTDSVDSENIQSLLNIGDIQLVNFDRALGYAKLDQNIEKVRVNKGSLDLRRNFPSVGVDLVASTTDMLSRSEVNSVVQYALLKAASHVSGKKSYFADKGEFPCFKNSIFPESDISVQFLKNRGNWMYELFPFWLAAFISKISIFAFPIIGVVFKICKSMPNFKRNREDGKIKAMYRDLREAEVAMRNGENEPKAIEQLLFKVRAGMLGGDVPSRLLPEYYKLYGSFVSLFEEFERWKVRDKSKSSSSMN